MIFTNSYSLNAMNENIISNEGIANAQPNILPQGQTSLFSNQMFNPKETNVDCEQIVQDDYPTYELIYNIVSDPMQCQQTQIEQLYQIQSQQMTMQIPQYMNTIDDMNQNNIGYGLCYQEGYPQINIPIVNNISNPIQPIQLQQGIIPIQHNSNILDTQNESIINHQSECYISCNESRSCEDFIIQSNKCVRSIENSVEVKQKTKGNVQSQKRNQRDYNIGQFFLLVSIYRDENGPNSIELKPSQKKTSDQPFPEATIKSNEVIHECNNCTEY